MEFAIKTNIYIFQDIDVYTYVYNHYRYNIFSYDTEKIEVQIMLLTLLSSWIFLKQPKSFISSIIKLSLSHCYFRI